MVIACLRRHRAIGVAPASGLAHGREAAPRRDSFMRSAMRALQYFAVAGFVVSVPASVRADERTPPMSAPPAEVWYGWQPLISDGAATASWLTAVATVGSARDRWCDCISPGWPDRALGARLGWEGFCEPRPSLRFPGRDRARVLGSLPALLRLAGGADGRHSARARSPPASGDR